MIIGLKSVDRFQTILPNDTSQSFNDADLNEIIFGHNHSFILISHTNRPQLFGQNVFLELNRNNEILQHENEKLRVQLKSQSNESNNSNNGDGVYCNGVENNNLSFTFTTDNPMLQMHELTKEMEALKALSHSRDYINNDSRANSDILSTDSGHTSSHVSDFGSRLNLSAAADMARVQRSQFKIQELEKEAERARFCNRNLMQEYAEQLKVSGHNKQTVSQKNILKGY